MLSYFVVFYDVDLTHVGYGEKTLLIKPSMVGEDLSGGEVDDRREWLKYIFLHSPHSEELVATGAEAVVIFRINCDASHTPLAEHCASELLVLVVPVPQHRTAIAANTAHELRVTGKRKTNDIERRSRPVKRAGTGSYWGKVLLMLGVLVETLLKKKRGSV